MEKLNWKENSKSILLFEAQLRFVALTEIRFLN
jgi:hypothetical protein